MTSTQLKIRTVASASLVACLGLSSYQIYAESLLDDSDSPRIALQVGEADPILLDDGNVQVAAVGQGEHPYTKASKWYADQRFDAEKAQFSSLHAGKNQVRLFVTGQEKVPSFPLGAQLDVRPAGKRVVSQVLGDTPKISVGGVTLEEQTDGSFTGLVDIAPLRKDSKLEISIDSGEKSRDYKINLLPEDYPDISVLDAGRGASGDKEVYYANYYGARDAEGDTLTSRSFISVHNEKGETLRYLSSLNRELVHLNHWENARGESGYYYFVQDDQGLSIPHKSYRQGYYVVTDEDFNEIDRVVAKRTKLYQPEKEKAEVHEFHVFGKGDYLILDYVPYEFNGAIDGKPVMLPYIQHQKFGRVVWEYFPKDEPYFRDAKLNRELEVIEGAREFTKRYDLVHTNAVAIDPKDKNIVMSNRNLNSIVKIDRNTKNILWVMGGDGNQFDFGDAGHFARQHDVGFDKDGNMMLFDNGLDFENPDFNGMSRGLVLKVDEKNKRIEKVHEFYHPEPMLGTYTGAITQDRAGNYTVSWGMERTHPDIATVFSPEGKILQTLTSSDKVDTYRVFPGKDM